MSQRIKTFENDLRTILVENALGEDAKSKINKMGTNRLVAAYIQWADKYVRPEPREILQLDGFNLALVSKDDLQKFNALSLEIGRGNNLSAYLSDSAAHSLGSINPGAKGIGWVDSGGTYDMFLNGYGIHHLHLNPKNKNGKRRGSSDTLLFVGFSRKEAVVLMMGNHKSFNDGSLLDAVTRFQSAIGFTLKGVMPPLNDWSGRDHQRLMRNGVNTVHTTDEGDVVPSMIASAGNGTFHTMHADRICSAINSIDEKLDSKEGREALVREYGWNLPASAEFQYGFNYCDFGMLDNKTGKTVFAVPWRR